MVFRLDPSLTVHERLLALTAELDLCARALEQGDPRDMVGMEQEVALLCERLLTLPVGEAQAYLPVLDALMADFTALGEQMHRLKDGISDELNDLGRRHQALKAYGMRGTVNAQTPDEDNE